MNLLGKILTSSQRGKSRPWYSHRYIGRLLLVAIIVFIYEYYNSTKARSFADISEEKILRVGYLKAPDVAFESSHQAFGFQYDIIAEYAEQNSLEINLHQVTHAEAIVGLNTNQFDILIGHFARQSTQLDNPFSAYIDASVFRNLLTKKDFIVDESATSAEVPKNKGTCEKDEEDEKVEPTSVEYKHWQPYQETAVWHCTNPVIFEHKEPMTPRTRKISIQETVAHSPGFPINLIDFSDINLHSIGKKNLLESVSKKETQYGLTTLLRLGISQKFISKLRKVKTFKEKVPLVWLLPKNVDPKFRQSINAYLQSDKTEALVIKQGRSWWRKYRHLNSLDILSIHRKIESTLPEIWPLFNSADETENISWTLLAALAYQESKWNIDAVSPTKVRGLMQITEDTAKTLGVSDRKNPKETVPAAARYIKSIEKKISINVKRQDRIWLAIAAYNLGPGRISQAYKEVRAQKASQITWDDIAEKLTYRSEFFQNDQYSTGKRAVEYVERIREFQKILRYYSSE